MKRFISLISFSLAGLFISTAVNAEEANMLQQQIGNCISENSGSEEDLANCLSKVFNSSTMSCEEMATAYKAIIQAAASFNDEAILETVTRIASKLAIVSMVQKSCYTADAVAQLVAQIGGEVAGDVDQSDIIELATVSGALEAGKELGFDGELLASNDPQATNPDEGEDVAGVEVPTGGGNVGPTGGNVAPTDPTVPVFFDDQIVVSATP